MLQIICRSHEEEHAKSGHNKLEGKKTPETSFPYEYMVWVEPECFMTGSQSCNIGLNLSKNRERVFYDWKEIKQR